MMLKNRKIILAGSLVDGSGGAIRRQMFLAVEDGILTAIAPMAELSNAVDTVIDDLSHCTIVPPLVDCSVLLASSPAMDPRMHKSEQNDANSIRCLVDRHLADCFNHGVLGVANSSAQVVEMQHAVDKTWPRLPVIVRSARQWQDREEMAVDCGQHAFLRITYSADIESMDPFTPRIDLAAFRFLLAQSGQCKKVVVVNGPQAVGEALDAGCDAIEQGYAMGEEHLRTMAERQVLWIPSLLRAKNGLDGSSSGGDVCCRFSLRFVAPGKPIPGAEASWKSRLAQQLAQLRLARSLGVPTAIGTGAGGTGLLHGESVVEEMKLFLKAGYSLEETLQCASQVGARFFAMDELGALTVGQPATFLVTRGIPQQLPRKLSYLENIYHDGTPCA